MPQVSNPPEVGHTALPEIRLGIRLPIDKHRAGSLHNGQSEPCCVPVLPRSKTNLSVICGSWFLPRRGRWWGGQRQVFKIRKLGLASLGERAGGIQCCSYRMSPPPPEEGGDRAPRGVESYFETRGPGFQTQSSSTPNLQSRHARPTSSIDRPAVRHKKMEREVHREGERGDRERERNSHRERERETECERERERAEEESNG